MDEFRELKLHVDALASAVEAEPKFFASIAHYVQQFRQVLSGKSGFVTQDELSVLALKIEEFWKKWRPSPSGRRPYIPPRQTADTDDTVRQIGGLVNRLASMEQGVFEQLAELPKISHRTETLVLGNEAPRPPCVFLGHGRSKLWARVKIFLEDELGLATLTYESEPRVGESIVSVLERLLGQATFAVLVLTGEDEGPESGRRARQNVIHEAGLFQGRLGFRRAVLLMQAGVDSFSNVDGLQHIPFGGENIEQTFYELQRGLRREGQLSS